MSETSLTSLQRLFPTGQTRCLRMLILAFPSLHGGASWSLNLLLTRNKENTIPVRARREPTFPFDSLERIIFSTAQYTRIEVTPHCMFSHRARINDPRSLESCPGVRMKGFVRTKEAIVRQIGSPRSTMRDSHTEASETRPFSFDLRFVPFYFRTQLLMTLRRWFLFFASLVSFFSRFFLCVKYRNIKEFWLDREERKTGRTARNWSFHEHWHVCDEYCSEQTSQNFIRKKQVSLHNWQMSYFRNFEIKFLILTFFWR